MLKVQFAYIVHSQGKSTKTASFWLALREKTTPTELARAVWLGLCRNSGDEEARRA
jgi:hypothetical protein